MDNSFQIHSASVSDRGLSEKRPQNEDSYLEMPNNGLFAVADGVGGAQAGDVASQMAVEILAEAFSNLRANSDAEEVMKIAIERANEAIFQMSHDIEQLSTMATTIVALHLSGNIATIGHVGDSRLYRLDQKGNLYRETQDHSVVEEEVRAGRMTAAQAATHPSRNVISRALGADSAVEVDMKVIMFEPETVFLLCSDGITRHIDDFQLRDLLMSGDSPAQIARKMKEICYERGAEDNLTAVIAKVSNEVAENYVNENVQTPIDFEESTVARARPTLEFQSPKAPEIVAAEEIPTRNSEMFVSKEINSFENSTEEPPATKIIDNQTSSTDEKVEVKNENVEITPVPVKETTVVEPIREIEKVRNPSSFQRILSPLLLLMLGGLIGAGIYHLWAQKNLQPETPQLPVQQSANIAYTSFEDARRNVDANPEKYIFASGGRADSPEDYYLLGRAYLLTGKYNEAKTAFEDAKNRLAQAEDVNENVLANDIAAGLSIVNNPFGQKEFTQQTNKSDANANLQTNANLNLNSINGAQNMNANNF